MPGRDKKMAAEGLPIGVWPVMLTPFCDDGSIDWRGLDELVEWYLQARVAGLFANAQSAEVSCLTEDERIAVAQAVRPRRPRDCQ